MTRSMVRDVAAPVRSGLGATTLSLLGFLGATGAAACCALPLLFATLGLGTALIGDIAFVAAPYRSVLLGVGAAGLIGGAVLFLRAYRTSACASEPGCMAPAILWSTIAFLATGPVLLYFGYVYV
jgi:mercuric ion transport protein